MNLFIPTYHHFPPLEKALDDGLLAVSNELSVEWLMAAYPQGIFPWFRDEFDFVYWYSPDPRCVLFPESVKVSKSMKQLLRNTRMEFRFNFDFQSVITQCSMVEREDGQGSWIDEHYIKTYTALHEMGFAVSGESWLDDQLVAGCYGVWMNGVWFGESMFSTIPNASKFAFINTVEHLKKKGLRLIDCQQETSHLKSLGAELISRNQFVSYL